MVEENHLEVALLWKGQISRLYRGHIQLSDENDSIKWTWNIQTSLLFACLAYDAILLGMVVENRWLYKKC